MSAVDRCGASTPKQRRRPSCRRCSQPTSRLPSLARRELRDAVQAGSLAPECALANATLVPDLLVLHAAAYKALAAAQRGELRTRSLHAELVFSLSGSKHVSGLSQGGCAHAAGLHAAAAEPARLDTAAPAAVARALPCGQLTPAGLPRPAVRR